MHALIHPVFTGNAGKDVYYLPSHIGQVILHDFAREGSGVLPETLYSYIRPHTWTPGMLASYYVSGFFADSLSVKTRCDVIRSSPVKTEPDFVR
jgi:hypothetical protein